MRDSTCTAPGCGQPVTDAFLCNGCVDWVRRHLHDLAGDAGTPADRPADRGLLADLSITMSRQDVADPDTARPAELDQWPPRVTDQPIAEHPLPVHLGAAKVLAAAHLDLRRWVRLLVDSRHGSELQADLRTIALERTRRAEALQLPSRVPNAHLNGYLAHEPRRPRLVQLPDARSPRELALWLGRHLHDLRQHAAAGQIAAGLARHRAAADRAVTGRDVEYLGLCTECWEERQHAEHLYAERGSDMVTCPRCGGSYDAGEMRGYLLRKVADERVRAAPLSAALVDFVRQTRADLGVMEYPTSRGRPLTAAAIRGMADRGRIMRYRRTQAEIDAGEDPEPRYQVKEVMDLVVAQAEEDRDRMARRKTGARR